MDFPIWSGDDEKLSSPATINGGDNSDNNKKRGKKRGKKKRTKPVNSVRLPSPYYHLNHAFTQERHRATQVTHLCKK